MTGRSSTPSEKLRNCGACRPMSSPNKSTRRLGNLTDMRQAGGVELGGRFGADPWQPVVGQRRKELRFVLRPAQIRMRTAF